MQVLPRWVLMRHEAAEALASQDFRENVRAEEPGAVAARRASVAEALQRREDKRVRQAHRCSCALGPRVRGPAARVGPPLEALLQKAQAELVAEYKIGRAHV